MARQLDIAMIVPQHGAPSWAPAIQDFFAWIENLKCGIDLFDDRAYQVPTAHIDPVTRQMRPPCGRWVDTLSRAAGGRPWLPGNKPHDKRVLEPPSNKGLSPPR